MTKIKLLIIGMLFSINSFSQGNATTYSGSIRNYSAHPEFTTGSLILHNAVTGADVIHLIQIAPNGTFSIEFPLMRNQSAWLMFPFSRGHYVYFEPGNRVIHEFDLAAYPEIKSNFKGDLASLNNDLWKASIATASPSNFEKELYGFTPEQYKTFMQLRKSKSLKSLDSLKKQDGLGKVAYSRAKAEVNLESAISLMKYSYQMEVAHRLSNSISFANKTPTIPAAKLDASYYDFLSHLNYNYTANLSLPSYRIFLVYLQQIDPIEASVRVKAKTILSSSTNSSSAQVPEKEIQDNIEKLSRSTELIKISRQEVLKKITKANVDLEIDLLNIQQVCNNLRHNQEALTDSALLALKSELKHPNYISEVIDLNDKIKKKIAYSRIAKGSKNNETPKGAADSLMTEILNKYKGKIVFIDFWATWCGPCLLAIENLRPIKTDLMAKDIVFLYLTNATSPEKPYRILSAGIKGEHFRLTAAQYDLISSKLGIVGFPHYAIANRNGVITDQNYRWNDPLKVKEKLTLLADEPNLRAGE